MSKQFSAITHVPSNLGECFSEDVTSSRLRKWSVGIRILGYVSFAAAVISGLIVASNGAKTVDFVSSFIDSKTVERFDAAIFWSLFTPFLLYGAVGLLSLLLSSLMLSGFASIVYHNKVTAYTTVYAARPDGDPAPTAFPRPAFPRPADAAGGSRRFDDQRESVSVPVPAPVHVPVPGGGVAKPYFDFDVDDDGTVRCPNCGSTNMSNRTVCWSCNASLRPRGNP